MLALYARLPDPWPGDAYVARIEVRGQLPGADARALPRSLEHLDAGDIVRVVPNTGTVYAMVRYRSTSNTILLTEECNSRCIMCSQPPRATDPWPIIRDWLAAIPLIEPGGLSQIGITGGEPTLVADGLALLLESLREHVPETHVHVLSNGRLFSYTQLARRIAQLGHGNLTFGIPLYADNAATHDFVVQAAGAFRQTILGLSNLARFGVGVEIRVVLHAHTVPRLPALARFIARHLPFASHVALMGLELMGYARANLDAIWIDPVDYRTELQTAVGILATAGLATSIYNLPLCVLEPSVRSFARQSISDWKNEYVSTCDSCVVRSKCSGIFTSGTLRLSRGLRAIELDPSPT